MTIFYFVRHGQSEGNLNNRFIGHGNAALTELGRKQAEMTGVFLSEVKFDCAFTSDLVRASETGEIILKNRKIPLIAEKNLREIYAGEWEGKTFSAIDESFSDSYAVWRNDIGNAKPDGGETLRELFLRVNGAIETIAENYPNATVLVTTHATPIRCVVTRAMGKECAEMRDIPWAPNSSVTIIGVEGGSFTVVKPSSADHLGEIATFLPKNV